MAVKTTLNCSSYLPSGSAEDFFFVELLALATNFSLSIGCATLHQIQCRFSNGVGMKLTRDIQSLSTFKRDTAKIVRQLKKTGQPVVLTVNGKAELVIQDAESYQKLLEAQDRMDALEGIRRGLESMKRNAGKPAAKFFREFFAQKGISEHE